MFYHPATQRRIASGSAFEIDGMQYSQNWLNLSTAQDKSDHGIHDLATDTQPTFDPITQLCVAGPIEFDGSYHETWTLLDLPEEAIANNRANAAKTLQEAVVTATQARLDTWAKEKNYDGILSACTYASSTVLMFQADGQLAVNNRDATWSTLYTILAGVQAGTRPMPTGFADIEPLLPVLTWPV